MNKQKIALFLSLTWLIGLIAVFSFPPHVNAISAESSQKSIIQKISSPDLLIRTSSETLKVPSFKIDWRFDSFLNPTYSAVFFLVYPINLASSFYADSGPLFNVLITFFHFFHTW